MGRTRGRRHPRAVGVADVDATVPKATPIDRYAAHETTTVYAGVHTFPMLPEFLSFDLTSLIEGEERAAVVIEFLVTPDGELSQTAIFRARVRNRAKLAYSHVGPWLEGAAALSAKVAPADLRRN